MVLNKTASLRHFKCVLTICFHWELRKISILLLGFKTVSYLEFFCFFLCWGFTGPVNPKGSCRAQSVYLTTLLLGRLTVHNLSPENLSGVKKKKFNFFYYQIYGSTYLPIFLLPDRYKLGFQSMLCLYFIFSITQYLHLRETCLGLQQRILLRLFLR